MTTAIIRLCVAALMILGGALSSFGYAWSAVLFLEAGATAAFLASAGLSGIFLALTIALFVAVW